MQDGNTSQAEENEMFITKVRNQYQTEGAQTNIIRRQHPPDVEYILQHLDRVKVKRTERGKMPKNALLKTTPLGHEETQRL